ncbi:MAG: esterase, partial [Bryobacteraceae bacterium]|nr:esterase [Bryobacteraceae bacterium]
MKRLTTLALFLGTVALLQAQQPAATPPRPINSPEVQSDKRVTFRFRNPAAKEVLLSREGAARVPMQRGEDGVWTLTTDPLPPDMYGYSFVADGISLMDPLNPAIKPNLLNPQSVVHVSGGNVPWDVANVPRGTLHRHFYHSGIVGDDRDYYVYTPPGYDPATKKLYPTLYLLHGFSDDASGWTSVGQAHVILDNLIAQGKVQPMLVVMTLGYGAPEIVSRNAPFRDSGIRQRSFERYRDSLFQEVMPKFEKDYRVTADRSMRAIAGLSMGGAESLYVGLNALDKFAYVGAFSSGGLGEDLGAQFPKLDSAANSKLKLLYISCGTEDRLIESNRKVIDFLKSKQVTATLRETTGGHTWMVWRRNLADFAPMLFR